MDIKPGRYIVVEGLEGAGKTTAMKTIKRFLAENDIEFVTTREPGATIVGESVRNLIKDPAVKDYMDPRTELLLFYAARIELLEQVIKPALKKGQWVLSDRCELSSFAYQGGGRKIDEKMLYSLSDFCVKDCLPDLMVFLDIKPEQGLERAKRRGKLDRIEQESLDFFRDVYDSYHKHLKNIKNVAIIDAKKPLPIVQNIIREKLSHAIITVA
ncbi:MAG: dTMP kinase [Legionellaceae bacterium]|nr:dTMP kinase [Legionellaceae bacterium]